MKKAKIRDFLGFNKKFDIDICKVRKIKLNLFGEIYNTYFLTLANKKEQNTVTKIIKHYNNILFNNNNIIILNSLAKHQEI